MPKLIGSPTKVPAPGKKARTIEEYVGLVNTGDAGLSVAQMRCAPGWEEPAQCAKFEEVIVVLKGMLRVEYSDGALEAEAGQAVHVSRDEWVRYSTPGRIRRGIHCSLRARIFPGRHPLGIEPDRSGWRCGGPTPARLMTCGLWRERPARGCLVRRGSVAC